MPNTKGQPLVGSIHMTVESMKLQIGHMLQMHYNEGLQDMIDEVVTEEIISGALKTEIRNQARTVIREMAQSLVKAQLDRFTFSEKYRESLRKAVEEEMRENFRFA